MTRLTKPQRARLEKLATYLEGLPKGYRHFDMKRWIDGIDEEVAAKYARHNGGMCGTVACAAGHGPAAGILVPPRLIDIDVCAWGKSYWVDWGAYCELFVGDDVRAKTWVFNGAWCTVDNHHWGAAARIRYLLDLREPPEQFNRNARNFGLGISSATRKLYAPYRIDAKAQANA